MPALFFNDLAGTRHELQMSEADQATLRAQGSRRAQEQWLLRRGYLEPDLPEEPTTPAPDPTEAIAALAAIEGRLQATEAQLQQFTTAEALGQLQLELQRWSAQAGRVSLAHAELSALADQTVASCDAAAAAAQARLNQLDADQAAMAAAIAAQLTADQAAATAAINSATSRIETALADAKAEAISEARAVAAQQVGPTGQAGAATVLTLDDPLAVDAASFASRWLGRPLQEGDGALVITESEIRVRRFTGGRWATGPSVIPRQDLVSARASVLDASVKQTTLISGGGGNSGLGGGGGESLLSRTLASGGSAMLSESARWAIPLAAAGLPAPDACTITLELTAADGGNAGRKLFITGKALYEGLATPPGSFTIYSELGELVGKVDVEFSIQSVPAVLPPGLPAVTLPPGVLSAQVFARITSNTSGATQFLLAGAVSWLQPNAVIPGSATTPPQIIPAWNLV